MWNNSLLGKNVILQITMKRAPVVGAHSLSNIAPCAPTYKRGTQVVSLPLPEGFASVATLLHAITDEHLVLSDLLLGDAMLPIVHPLQEMG